MKKVKTIISALCCIAALAACNKEIDKQAQVILPESSDIILPAAGGEQTFTVYADGDWTADVTEDWLSLSPTSGSGSVEVTILFDTNPSTTDTREAQILVFGNSKYQKTEIAVSQKPDRFRDAAEYSVSELYALQDSTLAKVKQCQVMAQSTDGFVAGDGESNIFVRGSIKDLTVGSSVTMLAQMVLYNGICSLELEDGTLVSSGEVTLPEATDISSLADYAPGKVELVSVTGAYSGGKITIDDKDFAQTYKPVESLNMASYELNKVTLTGYYVGEKSKLHSIIPVSVEALGFLGKTYLQFEIETSGFTELYKASWPTDMSFKATKGNGYIKYVPFDLDNTNANDKFAMDISGNDPRCTGPWPGDYWLFYGEDPISAHSEVQIKFGARTSATGHKFWILEYLDGDVWKTAGTPLTETIEYQGQSQNVVYTHAMNADGSTNVSINEKVVFTQNVEHGQFRFRCAANWQANGAGPLATRNGGSARLAVKNASQPVVIITKEGDGKAEAPEYASIECSVKSLSFDGVPTGAKTFKVTSDRDFTLASSDPWITLSPESGFAGEETTITATCAENSSSKYRETLLVVTSGDSSLEIPVFQSAAGQDLSNFISIVEGNSITVLGQGEEFSVNIQSNVSVETEMSDWLSVLPQPQTKTMVEVLPYTFKALANLTGEPRDGYVRFFAGAQEAILKVHQEIFQPRVDLTYCSNPITGGATQIPVEIDANVPFTISTSDAWITLPAAQAPAGTMTVPVAIAANSGAAREGTVTVSNAEYEFTRTYTIKQYGAGIVFEDDFEWMKPYTDAAGNTIGASVEENNNGGKAPNLYTTAALKPLLNDLISRGYEDLNPSAKVVYPQRNYWKFGKTDVNTGLRLPATCPSGDAEISFDWCPHMKGKADGYAIDPVDIVVEIEGSGKVVTAAGSASVSDPTGFTWEAHALRWQRATFQIQGLAPTDRIIIRPQSMTVKGVNRWYVDNISIIVK